MVSKSGTSAPPPLCQLHRSKIQIVKNTVTIFLLVVKCHLTVFSIIVYTLSSKSQGLIVRKLCSYWSNLHEKGSSRSTTSIPTREKMYTRTSKQRLCNQRILFRGRSPADSGLVEAKDDPQLRVGPGGQRPAGPRATSDSPLHPELWHSRGVYE